MQEFLDSLLREIAFRSEKISYDYRGLRQEKIKSIYLGGGTPSLLPLSFVDKILQKLQTYWKINSDTEITFEVNPGTVDAEYLSGLKNMGVNRLSIGVQSFTNQNLELLGRIHDQAQSQKIIEMAWDLGFENICADIIYGISPESDALWQKDLARALEFPLSHLSCYMLTLEPGTALYREWKKNPSAFSGQEEKINLFNKISCFLQDNGFIHYEVSNFARGYDNFSVHNKGYWEGSSYLGFGPSAHSFFVMEDKNEFRSWNVSDIRKYISCDALLDEIVEESEILTKEQRIMERIMLGLRTRKGIDLRRFYDDFDIRFQEEFASLIEDIQNQGLGGKTSSLNSINCNDYFYLNPKGWACLDHIVELFCSS